MNGLDEATASEPVHPQEMRTITRKFRTVTDKEDTFMGYGF